MSNNLFSTDVLSALDKYDHWIICPDNALWLVPWPALHDKDGRLLIEKRQLTCVVSSSDLIPNSKRQSHSLAAIFADPEFESSLQSNRQFRNFQRLPGTAAEARIIEPELSRWTGLETRSFVRDEATEITLKSLKNPHTLVLSTHGFFEQWGTANPLLRCGVALAGANGAGNPWDSGGNDGILTGLEVLDLDLRGTQLVILSACETGIGKLNHNEGFTSLRQAFHLAGAESVVASLWPVSDDQTAELMSMFVENLADEKQPPDALRLAQLSYTTARKERGLPAHPAFWAGFILTQSH